QNPRVEVVWRVRIILEDVGDQMRVAARDGFVGGRPHQRRRDGDLAAILRLYGKAADLGNPAASQEFGDIQGRIDEGETVRGVLGVRWIEQDAQCTGRGIPEREDEPGDVVAREIIRRYLLGRVAYPVLFLVIGGREDFDDAAAIGFVGH